MEAVIFICFFFSSRRRHTRSCGDWSSDVCSSDLRGTVADRLVEEDRDRHSDADGLTVQRRSEERRVGKECRSRWSAYPKKKNKKSNLRLAGRIVLVECALAHISVDSV